MRLNLDCVAINEVSKISKKTNSPYAILTLKFGNEMFDVYSEKPLGLKFGEEKKLCFEFDLKYKSLKCLGVV